MNNKKSISYKARVAIGAALCACLSAGAAALYYSAYHGGLYDKDIRHYASGNVTPAIAFSLFAVSAVISIITALSVKGAVREDEDVVPTASVTFGSFLTAFFFIGYFIMSAYSYEPLPTSPTFGEICSYVCPFLGLLSSVPFICDASGKIRRASLHRITTFIPIVWGAFLMFKYYFDLGEIPLNDPELAVTNVSIAAVILFFLAESRRALVISSSFKCAVSSFLVAFITLPIAAARIALCRTDGFTTPTIMENILLAVIGIFAVIRIAGDADSYKTPTYQENCDFNIPENETGGDSVKNAENKA